MKLHNARKTTSATVLLFLLAAGLATMAGADWKAKIRTTTAGAPWTNETALTILPKADAAFHIDVDSVHKLQTIDGFGGAFNEQGWEALNSLSAAARDSVMASLFDTLAGCKFNICRMPIGSSDYCLAKAWPLDGTNHDLDWYSLDETANDTLMTHENVSRDSAFLLQYIKAAMNYRPGLKMWGSPWSPPLWMKNNGAYNGGNLTWTPTICNAYARYLEKAVQLYRAQGINFFALSFQNEATQLPVYPGCQWTGNQHRDFIKLYLGPRFTDDGLNCEIWTPTMNCGDFQGYFVPMLGDPLNSQFITTVCFQWAGKNAIDQVNAVYPNYKKYQTEQECGQGETGSALWGYAVTSVYYNMKFYFDRRTSAYMQWNMVLPQGGFSSWGWPQNAMINIDTLAHTVTYNPQYYVVKHFSYYVKPGAKKDSVTGNYADQVMFQNPDGSIVAVLENENAATQQLALTFGSSMVNISLPPNSFATAVIYDSTANGVVNGWAGPQGSGSMLKIAKRGSDFVLMPQASSFDLQLVGLDGRVNASFSSNGGPVCIVKTNRMATGLYVLVGKIGGRKYHSTIPFMNN